MALFQEDSLDFISLWLRYHSVKWSVFVPFVIWLFLCMKEKKKETPFHALHHLLLISTLRQMDSVNITYNTFCVVERENWN